MNPMTKLFVHHFASRPELDAALTERLAQEIAAAGARAIMLAGGTTPLPAYRALAQQGVHPADGLHLLFSDDRYVPSDAQASNYFQSRALIDALALPSAAVLRVRTELPLEQAAQDYERALGELLRAEVPITLGLLGLGPDGHTASLFRPADLERSAGHLALAVQRPDGMAGISCTPRLLGQVHTLVFAVVSEGKRAAVAALEAQDANLVAWRAVQECQQVELWVV
jgi:6-phosphogluconolactonase/glucosamine-6-phosphate isomerase/deaminase